MLKTLKWIGTKTLNGIKSGSETVNLEIKKSMEESKRKRKIYQTEYDKVFEKEQAKNIKLQARKDAKEKAKKK